MSAFARTLALSASTARVAVVAAAAGIAIATPAFGAGHSLRFFGAGSGDIDRVKIRIDDPATTLPGPAADVGAGDFTIELWLKGSTLSNTASAVACGANTVWRNGNVVVDRDRANQDRRFGLSIAGGKVVYGVSGQGTGDVTLCGVSMVLDSAWHHVAFERRRSDGYLWLFVDGTLEAQGFGPGGDISYPDDGVPGNFCNGPCTNSDPFLVLGASKYDAGATSPAFSGWIDELRISTKIRYNANFPRPRAPFVSDRFTAALYHFNEGDGATLHDVSTANGPRADGTIKRGGTANGPQWTPDSPFTVGSLALNSTIALVPVVSGLSSPVEIVNANDGSGRLYVVQQGGTIRIVKNGVLLPTPFLDVTSKISSGGERGLLGLAFHPNYRANGRYFVYYTRSSDGALVIERYQRAADNLERTDPSPASVHTMLTIPHPGQSNHNGGKLAFGPDGYLYAGTGDGGSANDPPNNAQTLGVRLGKMLRLDVDIDVPPYYAIPPSNPFAAMTCDGAGVGTCPEIWAYGLRNPWRYSFDRLTGDQFIGDVGQDTREEVDWQPAGTPGGRNYGWKVMEGTICTPNVSPPFCAPPPSYVGPILDYPHDIGGGIAVTGGYRYRGDKVPALAGAYLYGDYGSKHIWAATVNDAGAWTTTYIGDAVSSLSAFGEDESGELYVAGLGNGVLYRIAPIDTDGNGLPDWWENAYFGTKTGNQPGADPDGDGATNLSEYLFNTDPLSSASAPSTPPVQPVLAVYQPGIHRFVIDVDRDRAPDYRVYFGIAGDIPLVGRVDTDGRYDMVVYRNGTWYADFNGDSVADAAFNFGGMGGDRPLLADFNGDGRDDPVIYRNGTWYVSTAQNGVANLIYTFGGVAGDVALAGDVDGDGIADLVIFRNGFWYVDTNRDGIADQVVGFGAPGDVPLLFDYDGDGRADFVVVRNGIWYVSTQRNSIAQAVFGYGAATDVPLGWRDR
jgi:glucose/arabinose dehydrogenase